MSTATARLTVQGGTVWFCYDCTALEVNGTMPEDIDPTEPAPLALWADEPMGTLSYGMGRDEHNPECDPDDDCECEQITFSWSRCEGCGSTLGGSRHAFTYWT